MVGFQHILTPMAPTGNIVIMTLTILLLFKLGDENYELTLHLPRLGLLFRVLTCFNPFAKKGSGVRVGRLEI